MNNVHSVCEQFAQILKGKGDYDQGVCSVALKRNFKVTVQGLPSKTVEPASVLFESLQSNGNALNIAEIAILPQEVPGFVSAIASQGMIVSALHNHWIFTDPPLLYIHIQSVEPPLHFARKVANSFTVLSSYPVPKDESE